MTTHDDVLPADAASAQADLAFMRTVLDERTRGWRDGGLLYGAAGLFYGIVSLIGVIDLLGPFDMPDMTQLVAHVISNGGFAAVLVYVLIRGRRNLIQTGVASRAVNAAFLGVGLANGAAAIVFAVAAVRAQDLVVWLLFVPVVAAFQGAAWFAVGAVMRRAWMRLVSFGWYVAAIAAGVALPSIAAFLVVMTIALFTLMLLPGIAMRRMGEEAG